jgi:hypothetical protein
LPDVTLQPGVCKVIFLSGKDRTSGELHANFGLSDDENEVFFTTLSGMRTESLSLEGITKDNISVGLDSERNIRYYASPTPERITYTDLKQPTRSAVSTIRGIISEVCASMRLRAARTIGLSCTMDRVRRSI